MPAVLSNLSQKHQDILTKDSRRLVSTPRGIRSKYTYGSQSNDLSGKDIINIFVNDTADIERWILANKKEKLNDFILMKDAFLNGYKPGFCSEDDYYSSRKKTAGSFIEKDVPNFRARSILQNTYHGFSVDVNDVDVSKISLVYNIGDNHFSVYILSKSLGFKKVDDKYEGKGVIEFTAGDSLSFIEMRHLLPVIEEVIDDAAKHRDQQASDLNNWFEGLKLAMNKWVSIMNI
jgi:hypothetical protein